MRAMRRAAGATLAALLVAGAAHAKLGETAPELGVDVREGDDGGTELYALDSPLAPIRRFIDGIEYLPQNQSAGAVFDLGLYLVWFPDGESFFGYSIEESAPTVIRGHVLRYHVDAGSWEFIEPFTAEVADDGAARYDVSMGDIRQEGALRRVSDTTLSVEGWSTIGLSRGPWAAEVAKERGVE